MGSAGGHETSWNCGSVGSPSAACREAARRGLEDKRCRGGDRRKPAVGEYLEETRRLAGRKVQSLGVQAAARTPVPIIDGPACQTCTAVAGRAAQGRLRCRIVDPAAGCPIDRAAVRRVVPLDARRPDAARIGLLLSEASGTKQRARSPSGCHVARTGMAPDKKGAKNVKLAWFSSTNRALCCSRCGGEPGRPRESRR